MLLVSKIAVHMFENLNDGEHIFTELEYSLLRLTFNRVLEGSMVIVANLCKRVLHQLVNGGLRAKIEELLLFVSKGPRIDQKEGLWY